jgi:hypothetical protein
VVLPFVPVTPIKLNRYARIDLDLYYVRFTEYQSLVALLGNLPINYSKFKDENEVTVMTF